MKEKIPFYNIVNMFFVGSVFAFLIFVLFHQQFEFIDLSSEIFAFMKDWSVVVSTVLLVIMYEIGFVLNRASSVIIEPILTKMQIWPKYKYDKDISEISESNSKFQSMITELVLMRTHILLYCIVAILSLFSSYKWFSVVCISIVVLFILAGRKHNTKINTIRKSVEAEHKKNNIEMDELEKFLTYTGNIRKK